MPNALFRDPSTAIPWKTGQLTVLDSPTPWPEGRPERISINGFGIGGTNVHIIVGSGSGPWNRTQQDGGSRHADRPHLLVTSAASSQSLHERVRQVTRYANNHPGLIPDLAYTLGHRRQHLQHRAFVVAYPDSPLDSSTFQSAKTAVDPKLVFVFNGQGAQWAGMGKSMLETVDGFREDLAEMQGILAALEDPLRGP